MEPIFENEHTRDISVFRDVAKFSYFSRPAIKIMLTIFSIYAVVNAIFGEKKLVGALFLLLVVAFCFGGYNRYIKIFSSRERELSSEGVIYTMRVFEDKIDYSTSFGTNMSFDFAGIKSVWQGKSTFLLVTKATQVVVIKKGAFTIGSDKEFVEFLNGKGFKVKFKGEKEVK